MFIYQRVTYNVGETIGKQYSENYMENMEHVGKTMS